MCWNNIYLSTFQFTYHCWLQTISVFVYIFVGTTAIITIITAIITEWLLHVGVFFSLELTFSVLFYSDFTGSLIAFDVYHKSNIPICGFGEWALLLTYLALRSIFNLASLCIHLAFNEFTTSFYSQLYLLIPDQTLITVVSLRCLYKSCNIFTYILSLVISRQFPRVNIYLVFTK